MEILHQGPYGKYKSNVSEEVLLSTIHMCHNFTERTFPFLEFEDKVPDANHSREVIGDSAGGGRRRLAGGGE